MHTADPDLRYTPSGVRLRVHARRPGALDWLFVPGGPGLGSESLHELVDAVGASGTSWLVDLPGDGSNVDAPGAGEDPYALWPQVLAEAAREVDRPVVVGHSMGGMYALATPELEPLLAGVALISTAPDASWLPTFAEMTERSPLVGVAEASARFDADPSIERLRRLAVLTAPWNFAPDSVEQGAALLQRLPYNVEAVAWSAEHFDSVYVASWFPQTIPTLIVSGSDDRVVDQSLWDDARFSGPNVLRREIAGAQHFPWIERPGAVREAFAELSGRIG